MPWTTVSPRPQAALITAAPGKPRLGIDGEHHPGAADVGAHHPLDADRERDLQVVEALDLAVADGPVGEQRGVAAAAGVQQFPLARDVQEGLLLPGEARVRQVLGRRAAAHRHGEPVHAGAARPASGSAARMASAMSPGNSLARNSSRMASPVARSVGVPGPVGGNARSHGGVDPVGRDERAVRGGCGGEPVGTRIPSPWRVRMSSPSEAFFPPTRGTSAMPISSNHITGDSAITALLWIVGGPILRGTGVPGSGALDPRAPSGYCAACPGPPPSKSPDTCGIAGTLRRCRRGSGELEGAGSRGVRGVPGRAHPANSRLGGGVTCVSLRRR